MCAEHPTPVAAVPEPETFRRTTAGGLTFDVRAWGPPDGVPVVALHGFPQGAVSWTGLAAELRGTGLRLIAFDQRGYSPGARPALSSYRVESYVDDVVELADACGLRRFHLVGFGMGGLQAWATAAAHPRRIGSVTALVFPHPAAFAHAIATDPVQAEAWERLGELSPPVPAARALLADGAAGLRAFLRGAGMPDAVVESTIDRVGDEDLLAAAIAWHLVSTDDMAGVGTVDVPALYVWSHSPALVRATSESCGRWCAGGFRSVELADAGHWLLETAPAAVAGPLHDHIRAAENGVAR